MPPYDSAWKDILKEQLRPFLEFFFPRIAAGIDFSREPEFLDKELEKLIPESAQPGRYADLLVRTTLVEGKPEEEEAKTRPGLLLCHIEVQGSGEADFAERLFQYAIRIYSRYGTFPATLVVLSDRSPGFRPEEFRIDSPYVRLSLAFHVAKILDYRHRRGELEGSGNPFSFVVEAQLQLLDLQNRRAKGEDLDLQEERYILKKRLMLGLLRRGFEKGYVRSLLRFLDWMLQLPREKETLLQEEIEEERGGGDMPYVTSWERIAEEKGKLVDKQQVLIRLLEKKYGLSPEERRRIEETKEPERLDHALDTIVFADSKSTVLEKL